MGAVPPPTRQSAATATATATGFHDDPRHPYTAALTAARPDLERPTPRLAQIPGGPVGAWEVADTCGFADRCPHRQPLCTASGPSRRRSRSCRPRPARPAAPRLGQERLGSNPLHTYVEVGSK
ncbi:MAG: oligopeptide/dipeptide ABC transporter ATP-binding protein [Mycobacteriaceae bacterium]